jgi:uncharacterized protein (TIGR02679 family)
MTSCPCALCGGRCTGADLTPLLLPELAWLWTAVADAADRRGDATMLDGPAVTVTAPSDPAARAAVAGLVARAPRPGRQIRVKLDVLTNLVQGRHPNLTPGAVAAHATGRTLALRALQRVEQTARVDRLRVALCAACDNEPELVGRGPSLFDRLRRNGWITRLDALPGNITIVQQAAAVAGAVMRIPDGERFDRRLLLPGDPHALDDGTALSGVTLTLLSASGRIAPDPNATPRSLWAQAGVDCDELMGGLTVLGIHPHGWNLPTGATCTLPPRELNNPTWPAAPERSAWVFVTENPSVLAAAADMVARETEHSPVRLICTMGTPSAVEIAAIAKLAAARWAVAVRADFDPAGIRHVTALLNGVPRAIPWRMTVADYRASNPTTPAGEPVPPTPWEPNLAEIINTAKTLAFEEGLIGHLMADLKLGSPPE